MLREEIYVAQTDGFTNRNASEKIYLLKKALYGLKLAARAWYVRINDFLLNLGFKRSFNEATLYIKEKEQEILIVFIYMDDILMTANNANSIKQLRNKMKEVFEMNDLKKMTFFLGMQVMLCR